MPIKSFRGQVSNDEATEFIRLSSNTGEIGYNIKKFQILPNQPEGATEEALITIWTTAAARDDQISSGTVNFSVPQLLAVAFWSGSAAATTNPEDTTVIFDNTTVNQDIYLTCKSSANMNYYIELEQVKLSVDEAAVATLKDMRAP